MLSERNLWPTFTAKTASTEMITERTFAKNDAGINFSIVCTRRLPLGCLVNNYTCSRKEPPMKGNQRIAYEEKAYSEPDYHVVWVEAKLMVDVALQRPTCAGGLGNEWLHTCIQGRMRMLIPLMHLWITVQSGGKQGRAHANSNGEDSYLM